VSWTYADLLQSIQDYTETDETTFVAEIPNIVKQAEDRILKNIQIPNFKKIAAGATVDGTTTLTIPSDFLAPYHLTVDNSGIVFLLFKNLGFIREAYPDSTAKGIPKHYAIQDDTTFVLGPTPNAALTTELYYFYRPTSIVDNSTSWLGTNAEALLLSACLLEAYIFLKGDADLMTKYETRYKEALQGEKILGEGRNVTDAYRNG